MSVPPLANTFEGGSDTSAITPANSGGASGDALDAVTLAGTSAWTYSSTQARDTLSSKLVMGATPGNTFLEWQALGSITGDLYYRFYLFLDVAGTGSIWLGRSFDDVGTATANRSLELRLNLSGDLTCQDQLGADLCELLGVITTQSWFRIEGRISCTTDTAALRVYSDPDGTTPSGEHNPGTTGTLAANQNRIRFGVPAGGSAFGNGILYLDNIAVSTTGWIGPAGGGEPPLVPNLNIVTRPSIRY